MTPIPHHPSVAPKGTEERWQQIAKRIRDLCESSGWEINQTQAELATAAVWDLLLCTPEERDILDTVADNPRPDLDLDAFIAEADAANAVIEAATAETNAEALAAQTAQRAAHASRTSIAHAEAHRAHRRLEAARTARKQAVRHLHELKAKR